MSRERLALLGQEVRVCKYTHAFVNGKLPRGLAAGSLVRVLEGGRLQIVEEGTAGPGLATVVKIDSISLDPENPKYRVDLNCGELPRMLGSTR